MTNFVLVIFFLFIKIYFKLMINTCLKGDKLAKLNLKIVIYMNGRAGAESKG